RGAWIERPGRRYDPTRGRKDHRIGEAWSQNSDRVASGRDQGIWVISPPAAFGPVVRGASKNFPTEILARPMCSTAHSVRPISCDLNIFCPNFVESPKQSLHLSCSIGGNFAHNA